MKFNDDISKKLGFNLNSLYALFNNPVVNNRFTKSLNQFMELNQKLKNINNYTYISSPKLCIPKIPNVRLQDAIIEEREKIKDLMAEVSIHQERANYLYNRLNQNPYSSLLLSISIIISIFLIIFCVSVPLLIIPTDTYVTLDSIPVIILNNLFSIKGLFITISTILICSIFIVFFIKNKSMKYDKEELEKLKKLTFLEYYSLYLQNYANNTK